MNTPEYIVVPFKPVLEKDDKYYDIANQVHQLLSQYVSQGWNYVGIEKVEAGVKGGRLTGDTVVQNTSIQVMIFKK